MDNVVWLYQSHVVYRSHMHYFPDVQFLHPATVYSNPERIPK